MALAFSDLVEPIRRRTASNDTVYASSELKDPAIRGLASRTIILIDLALRGLASACSDAKGPDPACLAPMD